MRTSNYVRALSTATALLVIAGCSAGGGSAVGPVGNSTLASNRTAIRVPSWSLSQPRGQSSETAHAFMSRDVAVNPVIYASSFAGSFIKIYKQHGTNQAPIGTITAGLLNPQGLAVTPNGDLWVANTGDSNILIYRRGALTAYKTLRDPGQFPVNVVVDEAGTAYVTNIITTAGGPGSVSVYKQGHTSPTSTLAIPHNSKVLFDTVDEGGTLYVNFVDSGNNGHTVKFVGGHGTPIDLHLTIGFPGGMVLDSTGDLVYADQSAPAVDVFELPATTPAAHFGTDNTDPIDVKFPATRQHIYVSDGGSGAVIHEYTYPAGVLVNTIKNGFTSTNAPSGLATDPAAQP